MLYIFIIIVFLAGIYFYTKSNSLQGRIEGFEDKNKELSQSNPRCPNILIQENSNFYLYNSKLAKIPGVNPVKFENLEDYTEFIKWQRSQGIRCPVLYLQKTYNTQGEPVYKIRPDVEEPQGGLPPTAPDHSLPDPPLTNQPPNPTQLIDAGRNDPPYNINSMPAYDPTSFYVGTVSPLDKMDETQDGLLYSPNPMDSNWGGHEFTQSLIDKGYYAGNEVSMRV